MQNGLVSIIIVTRNSAITLPSCLESIKNQTYTNYEILIVDNSSKDGTLSLINSETVTLLANISNLGFAKANNQALEIANGEFILFLNADATIERDFMTRSIPHFRDNPSVGAIAVKIFRPANGKPKVIDSAGLSIEHWRLLPRDRGEGEVDRGQYDHSALVFGAPGACALYRRSALDSAVVRREVMDEDFFAYYEDVDLAWRIRLQNWNALYVPEAIAYHKKSGPRSKEHFVQVKAFTNRYWCYVKNVRITEFLRYAPIAIPYEALRVCKTLAFNPSWILLYLREWRLLPKMLQKRRIVHNISE